jgi:Zn-dependent protease with chaperone function
MTTSASPTLDVQWFDGLHPVARPARLWFDANCVCVQADGDDRPTDYGAARLRWPEPLRRGQRQVLLPDGGVLACADAAAYDAWLRQSGRRHGAIARWQQSGWLALLTLALLAATLFAGWRWGVPLGADAAVSFMPAYVDDRVGEQVLQELDRHWLRPSKLSRVQRYEVYARLANAVNAMDSRALAKLTPVELQFREGGRHFGANALALPGGTIIVTDELVQLLADRPEAIVGVLGHELGHVRHRHGMRLTLRASSVGLATGALVGDFSLALATAPAMLAQQSYSRDFEREADEDARKLMRSASIDPAVMADFFERLRKQREEDAEERSDSAFAAAFSSHPADAERIAFFRQR